MFRRKKSAPPKDVVTTESDSGVETYFLKLALMGDGAVGKTNLRRNYLGQGFSQDHLMTIGADFAATDKTLKIDDRTFNITFQIWDLAGQSTFNQVRSMYYRGCFGALMVFDLTRPSSFKNITSWIEELEKHSGRGQVPMIVLGNKHDLVATAEHIVSDDEVNDFIAQINEDASEKGFEVGYLNTSALTGLNVDDAFDSLGHTILRWLGVTKK